MNTKRRAVELKTSSATQDVGAIQKGTDFLKCFMLGFDLQDSVAVLRLDDLYLETFEIKDVKTLHGDHLSRCIGRMRKERLSLLSRIRRGRVSSLLTPRSTFLAASTTFSVQEMLFASSFSVALPAKYTR